MFVYGKPDKEDANDLMVSVKIVYDEKTAKAEYGDVSQEELREIIWEKVKKINKTLPKYKYIKDMILTNVPLIKTSTNKVKRNEEMKLILAK